MYLICFIFSAFMMVDNFTLFDFNNDSNLSNWMVVDDGVMGGRSNGNFKINDEGHGVFYGKVSLENNGGFSSVRYRFDSMNAKSYSKLMLHVKGDGKRYQFRVKSNQSDRHSYIYYFQTSKDWETIEIPLKEMYPTFRGRKLEMPNFNGEIMEEIAFLIANSKAEGFQLEIDKIELL